MKKSSYLRFLNCLNAIGKTADDKKLDAIEEHLLNKVALAHSEGFDVLVGDLLELKSVGSPATLHGRIKNLIAMGYLKQIVDAEDNRRKKLVPTKYALKYYEALSKCLEKAISA
jgi:DNA topoisomerase IA